MSEIAKSRHPFISDKEWRHDYYNNTYEPLLRGLKDSPICLLEIGVNYGYSLGVWREYFTRATIIGVELYAYNSFAYRSNQHATDGSYGPLCQAQSWYGLTSIDPKKFYDNFQGCTIIYGDATDADTYRGLGKLDVVIDDGSHGLQDIVASFDILMPRLNDGGLYIIEDSPDAVKFYSGTAGIVMPHWGPASVEVVHIYDGSAEKDPLTTTIALRKCSDI